MKKVLVILFSLVCIVSCAFGPYGITRVVIVQNKRYARRFTANTVAVRKVVRGVMFAHGISFRAHIRNNKINILGYVHYNIAFILANMVHRFTANTVAVRKVVRGVTVF